MERWKFRRDEARNSRHTVRLAGAVHWRNQYAVHHSRLLWFAIWITALLLGPVLIVLILSGHERLAGILVVPYLAAILPGFFRMHRAFDKAISLSNATGEPSTAFAQIASSIPLSSDAWIPPYLYPAKPASFTRWLVYFSIAAVPVMAPFLHYPAPQVGSMATFAFKAAAFLLLAFSWLVVVIRTGLPLACYRHPIDTAEEICVWIFRDDLLSAMPSGDKNHI